MMNPIDILQPDWTGAPSNVGAFFTLRGGGVSPAPYDDGTGGGGLNLGDHVGDAAQNVGHNRALLQTLLPSQPVWLAQVHGNRVINAAGAVGVPQADASISTERNVVCTVLTADCLPVLLCDTEGKVVAAAHAGWRGLSAGILENTVTAMRAAGAADIIAWLGPAIGPQSFEVGQDVLDAFAGGHSAAVNAFVPRPQRPGKYLADIYQLARIRLQMLGLSGIFGGGECTVADPRRFYSYRRDGITGRMAAVIWLK